MRGYPPDHSGDEDRNLCSILLVNVFKVARVTGAVNAYCTGNPMEHFLFDSTNTHLDHIL